MTGAIATISRTASRARASRSRSTTCSAPATPSCPASCAAGWAARSSRPAAPGPMPSGAFAVSRLLCSPEYPTFAELQHLPAEWQPHRALRKDEDDQPHPLGDDPPAASPDTLMALAIDHRIAARGHGERGRRAGRAHRRLQGAGGQGRGPGCRWPPRLRHADRRAPMAARPCSAPPISRSGSAVRSSCPARGRCDFEGSGIIGAQLVEWPVGHTIKCLCFYHPDDPAELKQRQERELLRALRRRAQDRPRTAGRDHRRQARSAEDRHGGRASCSASTISASSPIGGSSSRRRTKPRGARSAT